MKYIYAYKTSDGIRHEDSMDASSREEVFTILRTRGIRAIKVVAADGSKANGEKEESRRKREAAWHYAVATAVVVLVSFASLVSLKSLLSDGDNPPGPATSSPRHQIYGDPATMEAFERGDFESVLPREGDRLLAIFAQPGRLMCRKDFNPRFLVPKSAAELGGYAERSLSADGDVAIGADDPREVKELKQIVNGMREEMREYLANGNGTPRSYWRRLNERTLQEMQIYERTRRELEKETSHAVWEEKNDALRRLGLRTIPNPKDGE